MRFGIVTIVVLALMPWQTPAFSDAVAAEYTSDGRLKFPEHYREWVYLSSGFDMSYSAAAQAGDKHVFDNVFVNPDAYRAFLESGSWPDDTVLVLEIRGAEGKASINQKGNFQGAAGPVEVHVRDERRFPGTWAFFGFDGHKPAKMIPHSAECYSCHAAHGAVDTTFVQFYPTLMPVAKAKGTVAAAYRSDTGANAAK